MKLFNIDLSYKHATRYIVDIHLSILLMIALMYLIDEIANKNVGAIIFIWGWAIILISLYRAYEFFVTTSTIKVASKNSVYITNKMYQKLRYEADKTNTSSTKIVHTALKEYFNSKEN